jgi:hypothetical protein
MATLKFQVFVPNLIEEISRYAINLHSAFKTFADFLQSPLYILALICVYFPIYAVKVRHNAQSCSHIFLFCDAVEHVWVPFELNELCSDV